mmetsp:Transcript_13602/g.41119  ORF Transcript_13602/g.41119 Transcript_13602/m.41119 type:complete len:201 (+) Transcript_13602:1346-1948(+)
MAKVCRGTPSFTSALARRPDSDTAMTVGIVTITNSVVFSLRNKARASSMRACSSSSFSTAASFSVFMPSTPLIADPAPVSFALNLTTFPIVLSMNSGAVKSLRVCPVGAVSNTTRVKDAYSGSLNSVTTLLIATISSMPGGSVSRSSLSCKSFSWSAKAPRPTEDRKEAALDMPSPLSAAATALMSSRARSTSISIPNSG